MPRIAKSPDRDATACKSNFNAARPLLQAIFLGILLAAALMVAAAMANPHGRTDKDLPQGSKVTQTLPHP
ncbi:hypothetical protein [Roseibium sp.]|uniref:hypothetical protein n=1 Tax=Roseibium sp. TaxID=1936156 RepID=UPI003D116053